VGEAVRDERGHVRAHGPPTFEPLAGLVTAVRGLVAAAGILATLPVVASLVLRQVDVSSPRLVAYVAATPIVVLVGVGAVVLGLVGGWHPGTAASAVLTATLALTQVPLYLGTAAAPDDAARSLTVMTVNMHYGGGDAAQIVAAVRDGGVDVLATEELTNPAADALRAAGIEEVLPHAALNPGGSRGNGLWSRLPLEPLEAPSGFTNEPVVAHVAVGGRDVVVAAVHPTSPYPDGAGAWSRELGLLAAWMAELDGPAVVAGDFNATSDHRQFRDLLQLGFADAAAQVGAGWLPTYPANRRRLPLLITIDHVLVSDGIVATALERLAIVDTDHTALVARLAVPDV
jgi:endonuclease/exonuclease/phosphatase (EEP) superfamily protein YafD